MADSTCTLVAPPVAEPRPLPPTRPRQEDCNEGVRGDLARLVDRQLPEITTALLHGDPSSREIIAQSFKQKAQEFLPGR